MRQFDVEAKKLNPDVFISGLIPFPPPPPSSAPGRYEKKYSKPYALPEAQFSYTSLAENRQISKNGVRSFEVTDFVLDTQIQDFTLSMICMPLLEGEVLMDSNLFSIELYDFYRYIVKVGSEERVIPVDETCHYMSISRKGNKLSISISERKNEIEIPDETINYIKMFSGPGSILIDKLVYSRTNNVPQADHYAKLLPSGDFNSIEEGSYIEWIFADEIEKGRVYSGERAELINDYYMLPLVGPHVPGAALRNLSRASIDISYDGGHQWYKVSGIEKIPQAMESAIVRSESMSFEFVLDDFQTEVIRLPGVTARVSGTVYPYHRDETTFYTNASYDFSNASISITPSEGEEMPNSIWLYGKISPAFIDNIPVTFLYRDGVFIENSMISDTTNHLYLIGFEGDELVLNQGFDTFVGINAIGISELDGSDSGQIKKTFDIFARNSTVSFAEEIPNVVAGNLPGQNGPFRAIDVQWTI